MVTEILEKDPIMRYLRENYDEKLVAGIFPELDSPDYDPLIDAAADGLQDGLEWELRSAGNPSNPSLEVLSSITLSDGLAQGIWSRVRAGFDLPELSVRQFARDLGSEYSIHIYTEACDAKENH